jgi:hypothetical protein
MKTGAIHSSCFVNGSKHDPWTTGQSTVPGARPLARPTVGTEAGNIELDARAKMHHCRWDASALEALPEEAREC